VTVTVDRDRDTDRRVSPGLGLQFGSSSMSVSERLPASLPLARQRSQAARRQCAESESGWHTSPRTATRRAGDFQVQLDSGLLNSELQVQVQVQVTSYYTDSELQVQVQLDASDISKFAARRQTRTGPMFQFLLRELD
jgi:hypothetical protein